MLKQLFDWVAGNPECAALFAGLIVHAQWGSVDFTRSWRAGRVVRWGVYR